MQRPSSTRWVRCLHLQARSLAVNLNLFRKAKDGTAAIEFAAVVPVFLAITFGILAYGFYLGAVHSVQQLSADAARASVAGLSNTERLQLAEAYVAAAASDYPLLELARVAVAASDTDGRFTITVTYDASHLPIWGLKGLVPMPAKSIERSAVIAHGGG